MSRNRCSSSAGRISAARTSGLRQIKSASVRAARGATALSILLPTQIVNRRGARLPAEYAPAAALDGDNRRAVADIERIGAAARASRSSSPRRFSAGEYGKFHSGLPAASGTTNAAGKRQRQRGAAWHSLDRRQHSSVLRSCCANANSVGLANRVPQRQLPFHLLQTVGQTHRQQRVAPVQRSYRGDLPAPRSAARARSPPAAFRVHPAALHTAARLRPLRLRQRPPIQLAVRRQRQRRHHHQTDGTI